MKRFLAMITLMVLICAMSACSTNNNEVDVPHATTPTIEPTQTTKPTTTNPTISIAPSIPPEPTTPPAPKTTDIVISFAGDNMLASYKNQTTSGSFNEYAAEKEPTYFLEKVRPIFTSDDFTIVNLENVFTDKNLKEVPKDHSPAFWYRSQTSNVNILTSSSVEGVSIANNHIYDYGQQGYKDTVETLQNANLDYGFNEKIMYFEKEGFVIAAICHGLWGEWQADDIVHLINTA